MEKEMLFQLGADGPRVFFSTDVVSAAAHGIHIFEHRYAIIPLSKEGGRIVIAPLSERFFPPSDEQLRAAVEAWWREPGTVRRWYPRLLPTDSALLRATRKTLPRSSLTSHIAHIRQLGPRGLSILAEHARYLTRFHPAVVLRIAARMVTSRLDPQPVWLGRFPPSRVLAQHSFPTEGLIVWSLVKDELPTGTRPPTVPRLRRLMPALLAGSGPDTVVTAVEETFPLALFDDAHDVNTGSEEHEALFTAMLRILFPVECPQISDSKGHQRFAVGYALALMGRAVVRETSDWTIFDENSGIDDALLENVDATVTRLLHFRNAPPYALDD